MRVCRFEHQGGTQTGFYDEQHIVPVEAAVAAYSATTNQSLDLPVGDDLLALLPPDGRASAAAKTLAAWVEEHSDRLSDTALATSNVQLLVPIPRPNKLFLLAGNYAKHIEEGGGKAADRAETFPWVFMKPPTTTLTAPGRPVQIPNISPGAIDWELELAVVIGRKAKGVGEADALKHVAGYTVVNDISNRRFRPNPARKKRERDEFFDWWHDSFCPCGPCITSADAIPDPQTLDMNLKVNGEVRKNASTAQQIFPVAAVIEFISSFVTLEPGDIISTGTSAGVGHASQTFLKPGDRMETSISSIGTVVSPVVAEA